MASPSRRDVFAIAAGAVAVATLPPNMAALAAKPNYTTYITYGNRENIGTVMGHIFREQLGGTDQEHIAAFNASIEEIDRASFPQTSEGDYQYMLALFRNAKGALNG